MGIETNQSLEEKQIQKKGYFRVGSCVAILLLMIMIGAGCLYISIVARKIPRDLYVEESQETVLQWSVPVTGSFQGKVNFLKPVTVVASQEGEYQLDLKLFDLVDLPAMNVHVVKNEPVYLGGFQDGLYMETNGVYVVGVQSVQDQSGKDCFPCANAVVEGDYIQSVDGVFVDGKSQLNKMVEESNGKTMRFELNHYGEKRFVEITPVLCDDGVYKIGAWIRDDTQGIGTVTFVQKDGRYGALGHGISDSTGKHVLQIACGKLYKTRIISIVKGENGKPGEFVGTIDYHDANIVGTIEKNRYCGIFGTMSEDVKQNYNLDEILVGFATMVHQGPAYIRLYVNGKFIDYPIEIDKVSFNQEKNITYHVTSKELLDLTNGIVQGMSGCPIIQDGRLVGAVTHVFVDDSTKGYGIFIETMLEELDLSNYVGGCDDK